VSETMVERVARAIHDAECCCGTWREPSREWATRGLVSCHDPDHYHSPRQLAGWVEEARAAIAALREPTEGMMHGFRSASKEEWAAAIDAALAEVGAEKVE
jgi:hypothetical protein